MQKIRTLDHLQEALDREMAWRIKEISQFKTAAKSKRSEPFTRAGLALLYAHWERFIKISSESYVSYISCKGVLYKDLQICFAAMGLRTHLSMIERTGQSRSYIEAVEQIDEGLKKASFNVSKSINTESNLSSIVFSNIARSIGILTDKYETKYNLIDESLLSRRNKIAHGEFLDLDSDDFLVLVDEVIAIMRSYKTDIENAASLKSYLRNSAAL